jgi:ABC-2 type transport system permease protein
MVALLSAVMVTERLTAGEWAMFVTSSAAMWSYFMLPLTVTALTILIAQLEHGPSTWNHLLALPVARWRRNGSEADIANCGLDAASSSLED